VNFYYCQHCHLVYEEPDTHAYYALGFPTMTSARGCPVDGSKLKLIDDDEVDFEIFDYLATP